MNETIGKSITNCNPQIDYIFKWLHGRRLATQWFTLVLQPPLLPIQMLWQPCQCSKPNNAVNLNEFDNIFLSVCFPFNHQLCLPCLSALIRRKLDVKLEVNPNCSQAWILNFWFRPLIAINYSTAMVSPCLFAFQTGASFSVLLSIPYHSSISNWIF